MTCKVTAVRGAALLVLLAVTLLVVPKDVRADDEEKAWKLYQKGVGLAKKEKFEEALKYFEEARDLGAPDEVLLNIGKCHKELGHIEEAAGYYQEYVELPDAKLADKAREVLEELRAEPSPVKFTSEPPGAEILDEETDEIIGTTPCEHTAEAGEKTYVVVLEGYEEKKVGIEAGYGKTHELNVELIALETGPGEETGTELEAEIETEVAPKPPSRFPAVGITVEAGGGAALFPYGSVENVDFQVGADISLGVGYHLAHGMDSGFSVGARVHVRTYKLTGDRDWDPREWSSLLMHILAVPAYQIKVHKRLAIEASFPLGIAMIIPTSKLEDNDFVNLVGGYIVNGKASLFDVGVGVALRIAIVSGFYLTVEPAHVHILVPLKKWHSGTKALVDLDIGARLGFEF